MQVLFELRQPRCVSCNFLSTKANSFSASADSFLGLFKSLSPCKVWNKLLSTWLAKPIVEHSQLVSPNNFWKSLRVLKWSFLICTFCDLSFCRLILGNKQLIEATRYSFFRGDLQSSARQVVLLLLLLFFGFFFIKHSFHDI